MNNNAVTIRITDAEAALLTAIAEQTGRTKTEIVREFIRSLETQLARPTKATPRQAKA
jgi:predicted DNA-binding protein